MTAPRLLQQKTVRIDEVTGLLHRMRPVSEAGVAALMASIGELGILKDAIHVRQKKDGALVLIAGAHRLEAMRRLGHETIEAKVWADVTDDWARLMEIDDNLAGAEMTALDTAVFLARRKEVYERLHPEAKWGGDRKSLSRQNQTDIVSVRSFADATAEKFGLSERQVFRMLAAGSKLGPDEVASLRSAPRPVTLKDLGDIGRIAAAPDRYTVVRMLSEGQAKSASAALGQIRAGHDPAPARDPQDVEFKALLAAWTRASVAARMRFIAEVGLASSETGGGND